MQDRSTTSLGAELAGAAHEFRHARHRAKLLLNALRGRVAKNNAAGDEQDHRMEMARHINLAGSAKSKPEWKKHMDAAAHHQRMVNDLQAHRTRVQQGHESRLRGSLPDYKPHELKMYLGLLESGDTHGVAVHTIKGERLMDAYKQRGTKNSAQKKPVPSWKNDLERIHSNYVVHHHELEGQKVEDVHARIVGLGFRRVSKTNHGGSKRYGQLPETVHHYRHPDGRLMFMRSVGSGAMYMTEHVPWAKNRSPVSAEEQSKNAKRASQRANESGYQSDHFTASIDHAAAAEAHRVEGDMAKAEWHDKRAQYHAKKSGVGMAVNAAQKKPSAYYLAKKKRAEAMSANAERLESEANQSKRNGTIAAAASAHHRAWEAHNDAWMASEGATAAHHYDAMQRHRNKSIELKKSLGAVATNASDKPARFTKELYRSHAFFPGETLDDYRRWMDRAEFTHHSSKPRNVEADEWEHVFKHPTKGTRMVTTVKGKITHLYRDFPMTENSARPTNKEIHEPLDGGLREWKTHSTYKGHSILHRTVATRFGILHQAKIDSDEPMNGPPKAFKTQQEAIGHVRKNIDYWIANSARPTKQSELWRQPLRRPHKEMSDDELRSATETALGKVNGLKFGSDLERLQHPDFVHLTGLVAERGHRDYDAEIRAGRIRRRLGQTRFPKQWPVKNNATNINADKLSAKAHDLTHQIKDIGDASSKINAHALALDAHMSAQEAHRSAIRELQARIAHHRTAIGAHEHKIIHHDRHISLLTRLPVVKNSAASDVREQSESVIQTIRAGKSSPWGPWKKHSIHQGKTIYVREAKTGGGRSLWMAMKEGHLPSEWRPKFTDVNAAVDHAKYVTNSTGVHPATLSEAAEDASDKAWKTDDRYDHVLAMRAHLKAEKAHTNLIKQHHHAMTAGLHNDRVKQLGRTKNSSPAWTPPIGFTHTRCANGSTVGAFTGSPMISGFSKSQTAQNAGAGKSLEDRIAALKTKYAHLVGGVDPSADTVTIKAAMHDGSPSKLALTRSTKRGEHLRTIDLMHASGYGGVTVNGKDDSWEKQNGGFANQDHARAAAREFAFSSDAARDLSLVPTHHNHEGANFPALEVPSKRRMQVLKARMDQFGVKYKDVGNNTVAVWHPSMKMVANSGDRSDIARDKESWAATRAARERSERAYDVGGFGEHVEAMELHRKAAELHKASYPHDSEKIIERRKNLVNEHNAEADLHENWLKRHFGKRMGSNSSAPVAQNVHRASGEQAPDLEKSLRAYEAAHKVWFSTPVHTDAGKAAKKSLDEARTAYEDAVRYHRPGTIIL